MNNKRILIKFLAAMFVASLTVSMTACGKKADENVTEVTDVEKTEENSGTTTEWTVNDLTGMPDVISGINDLTVLQNADKYDIKSLVKYDDTIVKELAVDDASVDYNAVKDYDATYTVKFDYAKLKDYFDSHSIDKEIKDEDGSFTVDVKTKVTVVDEATANQLKAEGKVVLTPADMNAQVAENTEAGSEATANSENNANEQADNGGNTVTPATDNSNSNSASNSNSNNKSQSQTTAKNAESNTTAQPTQPQTSAPTQAPAKEVTWVPHYTKKCVKEAYDEVDYNAADYPAHWISASSGRDLTAAYQASGMSNYYEWLEQQPEYAVDGGKYYIGYKGPYYKTIHHDAEYKDVIDYYYNADNPSEHKPA